MASILYFQTEILLLKDILQQVVHRPVNKNVVCRVHKGFSLIKLQGVLTDWSSGVKLPNFEPYFSWIPIGPDSKSEWPVFEMPAGPQLSNFNYFSWTHIFIYHFTFVSEARKINLKNCFRAPSMFPPKRFGVKVRPPAEGGELQESGLKACLSRWFVKA